jgi:carbohydrate-selective porin OprB
MTRQHDDARPERVPSTADVRIRNWTLATGTKPGARHERGLFDTRPRDTVGLAVASGYFSEALQRAQRHGRLPRPDGGIEDHETVLELTYRFDLRNGALFIQPDFQYIIRPVPPGRSFETGLRQVKSGVLDV